MFNNLFSRSVSQPTPASPDAPTPAPPPAAVQRTSVTDLIKKADVSLRKNDLNGQRAAVYLVLDRSGSMRGHYGDGSVQYLSEQTLGLARNLDDDGTVPVVFFSTAIDGTTEVSLDNYAGRIESAHRGLGPMGATHYEKAIDHVVKQHLASPAHAKGIPALVIFQTDGGPSKQHAAAAALRAASVYPLFWAFVGYGKKIEFLDKLDELTGRAVDNASHFPAADPHHVADEALYDHLSVQLRTWLVQARAKGIVR
ncbi:VWA domain-containing protein [Streptomyces sp. NPDC015125]|uniref:VWA domain-containing protein n=1 Tax=Streptomyces sp. NPDC015125 TaxID=3364938 RepID=UPI0036F76CC4